jgi:cobalt/nickel transport system permease protein
MPADFLDRFSRRSSVCHRLSALLKIVLTLAVILLAVSLPTVMWPAQGCLVCLVFVALTLAEIPLVYLARRMVLFLPFVSLIALAVPLSRGFAGGWEMGIGIVLRASVAFLAALWLVSTTPFDALLAALSRLGAPRLFTALVAFVFRYLSVLFDELARMRTAQRARSFGARPAGRAWKNAVQIVGTLLIRALNRAERVHGAMCARAWDGRMRTLDARKPQERRSDVQC